MIFVFIVPPIIHARANRRDVLLDPMRFPKPGDPDNPDVLGNPIICHTG